MSQLIGYILFVPFIMFYSYILGPVLKAVLTPGGLALLWLIMGHKSFMEHFRAAQSKSDNVASSVHKAA